MRESASSPLSIAFIFFCGRFCSQRGILGAWHAGFDQHVRPRKRPAWSLTRPVSEGERERENGKAAVRKITCRSLRLADKGRKVARNWGSTREDHPLVFELARFFQQNARILDPRSGKKGREIRGTLACALDAFEYHGACIAVR